ncbi:hypothetical protein GQ43DRAFT_492430 [Delitschia confertaspora ATCC 74209]|uniref:Uncharacterized protein n=1 Tax=Delitschia confertaspora ATCC 74209 TaxID=1513339 RepID=A0A9P4JGW6_9PLEO|nr:hypothetical protein GQ43DRAFT_492430 [Delitschia confertaspora ATCC 74209]
MPLCVVTPGTAIILAEWTRTSIDSGYSRIFAAAPESKPGNSDIGQADVFGLPWIPDLHGIASAVACNLLIAPRQNQRRGTMFCN